MELQEPNQQQFLQDLREKLVGWAEKEIEGAERRTASQEDRLRTAENIHKLMRTVLLDPAAEKECL